VTTTPVYGPQAPRSMLFAGTVLGLIGFANCIVGIKALSNSSFFPAHAAFVTGNLRTWGWIVLIVGIAQIVASFAIFSKSAFARWFGVATAGVNAITQLLFFPAHPIWALCSFAACLFVVRVLVVYGGRGWAAR
jgi:hypothetical protein